jgi:hypothetical protein
VNKSVDEWKIYRSSFLIRAKQLLEPLVFMDVLGHEHRGKKGDYLVEHSSGLRRIWPRQLFEDSHATLSTAESRSVAQTWSGVVPSEVIASLSPKPARAIRKPNASCGKETVRSRTPAVNCLRYNI